ncbi:MAG: DUF2846 domain-containing protein [Porticoccaceae bacterium]|nr:DUF2846 domain-containing protein [Porticoccaceae bacterium]
MKPRSLITVFCTVLLAISVTTAAQADSDTSVDAVETPNLIIYRPSQRAVLSYMNYRLYLNGKNLGKLANGKRMELQLLPGRYTLMANDAVQTRLQFDVQPGKTTLVKAEVNPALCMPMVDMEPQWLASTDE